MKRILSLSLLLAAAPLARAGFSVQPWTPIFKGIDHATGTNDTAVYGTLAANALRIDLQDPDIELMVTPPITNNYIPNQRETELQKPREFLRQHGLQVAINAVHFAPGSYSYPSGTPAYLHGLAISQGRLVSSQSSSNDALCALLFTTNNQATFVYLNWPATNTGGIYNAVAGMYPLLSNGVNIAYAYTNAMSDTLHRAQPRTAFGLSQDGRYLILLTIDGRQQDFSDGALDWETARFLQLFGAWNGMNMDGGGSTCMVRADACGNAVDLNQNSFQFAVNRPGDQRPVGCNFGVRTRPVPGFINDLAVVPGDTTATITWTTLAEATTQVSYGLTVVPDNFTPLDPRPVTNHSVTLTGLRPATNYYFRVLSRTESQEFSVEGCFSTTNLAGEISGWLVPLTNYWRYYYQNLDGQPWTTPGYNDTGWPGGPALLYNDAGSLGGPKNTLLPLNPGPHCLTGTDVGYPYPTYYFRTRFTFTNQPAGVTLTFSNFLDDGAVFYLNGVEVHRAYMPAAPTPIVYCMLASDYHCRPSGDATCPYMFTLSGSQVASLVQGENVLAVELHNFAARSPDIAFGSALYFTAPPPLPPPPFISNVVAVAGETNVTITWTTLSNATSQVEYGPTIALGWTTPLDPALVTSHTVQITDLTPATTYYFRVISTVGTNAHMAAGQFTTGSFYQEIVPLTQAWRYTTNNLDGQPWFTLGYDDDAWQGPGPALLFLEDNTLVSPRNTPLPPTGAGLPFPTYYFRTWFNLAARPAGYALLFSNYVDDGAVFYLNGVEIQRLRMPPRPAVVLYTNFSIGQPAGSDATLPDVFRVGGDIMSSLRAGWNLLAAEVHQSTPTSPDIVFGSTVGFVRATVNETRLRARFSQPANCVEWDGLGFTLQQCTNAADLSNPAAWTDVPGPVRRSPYCFTNPPTSIFFRLRN